MKILVVSLLCSILLSISACGGGGAAGSGDGSSSVRNSASSSISESSSSTNSSLSTSSLSSSSVDNSSSSANSESESSDSSSAVSSSESASSDSSSSVNPLTVLVEAENYDRHADTTAGNAGGAYRTDDVDIEEASDVGDGFNIGFVAAGEWLEYDISLEPGNYDLNVRVASMVGGGNYTVSLSGDTVGNGIVGATGGWQNWQTRTVGHATVVTPGVYLLRIDFTGGEFNLNWLQFEPSSSASSSSLSSSSSSSFSSSSSSECASNSSATTVDGIVLLYDESTCLEPLIQYDRGDALITRISDRARDRHAKEDHFQAYEHYLSFYWEHRTAAIEIVDYIAKGGSSVRMNVVTQWKLNDTEAENRWFYIGNNTVAEYCDNGTMTVVDDTHYYKERSHNCREGRAIQAGDKLEFELSQFLAPTVPNGRAAYYGTTYLYIVGEGLVPWDVGGATPSGGSKDSIKIPESAWLGGKTTVHAMTSDEPDNPFMQMGTYTGYDNAQPFMLGRRVLHSSFVDGIHDERPVENPAFGPAVNKAGPLFVNDSCAGCHVRNGRAAPNPIGQHLDKWVFRVGDVDGNPHPDMGRVLQPEANGGGVSEGQVSIASWSESDGLRSPNFAFTGITPNTFSARIAPQLVGIGLLEAIPEVAILALEDVNDEDADGISGKANRVADPVTAVIRLGRFGWKAGAVSVRHQVAAAFNTDMGVMTSVLPNPDCGSDQSGCEGSGSELDDEHLENLVKYISLLGVRAQRDYDDATVQSGEAIFSTIGCADCHIPTFQTSEFHPFAELRDQTIHPYTDMLLHDMGQGLADSLGEGDATGAEWRTTPLWGLGLSACVTGGITNPTGAQGDDVCTPVHSYLHDGRARSIEEAILWHGGEGQTSKESYQALSSPQQQDLLRFLESL